MNILKFFNTIICTALLVMTVQSHLPVGQVQPAEGVDDAGGTTFFDGRLLTERDLQAEQTQQSASSTARDAYFVHNDHGTVTQ